MPPHPLSATIHLPNWIEEFVNWEKVYSDPEERVELAIELSRQNVDRETGGPFGAAIFDEEGKIISVGVNVVISEIASFAHAEMTAILFAQKKLSTFTLAANNRRCTLAISCEPCGMCLTGILWSGISKIETAARGKDAEKIGFDEGFKPDNWTQALREKKIEVTTDILREKALPILEKYGKIGNIYNGRSA